MTNAAFTTGAINVYYVKQLAPVNADVGISYEPLKVIFIGDEHQLSTTALTAHEIGHQFGLVDLGNAVHPNALPDRLMWFQDSKRDPCRLIQFEWENVNDG